MTVTTTTTANPLTMTTSQNTFKRCKYGPHSRPRDKMETEENVAGPTLNDKQRITCILFSLSTLFCSLSNAASTSLHPSLTWVSLSRLPEFLAARHRPVDHPSHGAVHALEGQGQGEQRTESMEQVDLDSIEQMVLPRMKSYNG